jgi:hypothetical protein
MLKQLMRDCLNRTKPTFLLYTFPHCCKQHGLFFKHLLLVQFNVSMTKRMVIQAVGNRWRIENHRMNPCRLTKDSVFETNLTNHNGLCEERCRNLFFGTHHCRDCRHQLTSFFHFEETDVDPSLFECKSACHNKVAPCLESENTFRIFYTFEQTTDTS